MSKRRQSLFDVRTKFNAPLVHWNETQSQRGIGGTPAIVDGKTDLRHFSTKLGDNKKACSGAGGRCYTHNFVPFSPIFA
jgi:hypothetical protein